MIFRIRSVMYSVVGMVCLVASISSIGFAKSGEIAPLRDISECYNLNWSNSFLAETDEDFNRWPPIPSNPYVWYCQGKPTEEPRYIYRQFHSYQANRMDARDFALFRCEREYSSCTYRCALAPRSCAPSFWP